jgi:hypothetical protein
MAPPRRPSILRSRRARPQEDRGVAATADTTPAPLPLATATPPTTAAAANTTTSSFTPSNPFFRTGGHPGDLYRQRVESGSSGDDDDERDGDRHAPHGNTSVESSADTGNASPTSRNRSMTDTNSTLLPSPRQSQQHERIASAWWLARYRQQQQRHGQEGRERIPYERDVGIHSPEYDHTADVGTSPHEQFITNAILNSSDADGGVTGPVDVDAYGDAAAQAVIPDTHKLSFEVESAPCNGDDTDDDNDTLPTLDDGASTVSNAASEHTPVISNNSRKMRSHPHPPYHATVYDSDEATSNYNFGALDSIHEVSPTARGSDDSAAEGFGMSHRQSTNSYACCYGFFNLRSKQGKLAYALLLILLLAIATMIVSVTTGFTRNSNDPGDDASQTNLSGDSWSNIQTTEPTASPAIALAAGTTAAPTRYVRGTQAPSVIDVAAGTDDTPTAASDTGAPTNRPTVRPTTVSSTAQPSIAPSALSTTSAPTATPTQALENLQLSPLGRLTGPAPNGMFGQALALSRDGKVVAVGAPDVANSDSAAGVLARAGFVQVYQRVQDQWIPRGSALRGDAAQDALGSAVALNADGSILAVSEPNDDSGGEQAGGIQIYLYNEATGQYARRGNRIIGLSSMSYAGVGVALSQNGLRVAIGAPYFSTPEFRFAGHVGVYEYSPSGNVWQMMGSGAPLTGTGDLDWLGSAVDLSPDGRVVIASAPRNTGSTGYVRAWQWDTSTQTWTVLGGPLDMVNSDFVPSSSDNRYGASIALTTVGDIGGDTATFRVAVGIPWKTVNGQRNAGMTVVYEYNQASNGWNALGDPIVQETPTANDEAGSAVSLSQGLLAVGVPGANSKVGEVRLYRYQPSTSTTNTTDVSTLWQVHSVSWTGERRGDDFGVAIAMASNFTLAVGSIAIERGEAGSVLLYGLVQQPAAGAVSTTAEDTASSSTTAIRIPGKL